MDPVEEALGPVEPSGDEESQETTPPSDEAQPSDSQERETTDAAKGKSTQEQAPDVEAKKEPKEPEGDKSAAFFQSKYQETKAELDRLKAEQTLFSRRRQFEQKPETQKEQTGQEADESELSFDRVRQSIREEIQNAMNPFFAAQRQAEVDAAVKDFHEYLKTNGWESVADVALTEVRDTLGDAGTIAQRLKAAKSFAKAAAAEAMINSVQKETDRAVTNREQRKLTQTAPASAEVETPGPKEKHPDQKEVDAALERMGTTHPREDILSNLD